MGELQGRVAMVTGAGGGLGIAICEQLAKVGAAVACVGRTGAKVDELAAALRADGAAASGVEVDVGERAAVEAAADAIRAELGPISIVVNSAAIYESRPWTEITEEEWDRTLKVNLGGYFNCARAAYPQFVEAGYGRVINLTSLTFFKGWAGLSDYVSSKGGIIGFTRSLAREIGPEGFTVNAISPGAFPTAAEEIHPDPEGYERFVLEQQCLKRRGRSEDVGQLVNFLASERASFITGQTIEIDGGWITL